MSGACERPSSVEKHDALDVDQAVHEKEPLEDTNANSF